MPERSELDEGVDDADRLFCHVDVAEHGQGVSVIHPLEVVVVDQLQVSVKTFFLQINMNILLEHCRFIVRNILRYT